MRYVIVYTYPWDTEIEHSSTFPISVRETVIKNLKRFWVTDKGKSIMCNIVNIYRLHTNGVVDILK